MMKTIKLFGLAVAVMGLVGFATGQARAGLVVHQFSGRIISASGSASVTVGQRFSGSFAYDDTSPNQQPGVPYLGQYIPNPLSLSVEISSSDEFSISNDHGFLQIVNDDAVNVPGSYQDALSVDLSEYDDVVADRIQLILGGLTPSPSAFLSSHNLPGLAVDLSEASVKLLVIERKATQTGGRLYVIRGELDSFSTVAAVPEPTTLISGSIAGLFGLVAAWRKRRAKATA